MNPVLNNFEQFQYRHSAPEAFEIEAMLKVIGAASMDELIDQTVPKSIQLKKPMTMKPAMTESEFLKHARTLAKKNKIFKSYIGMGYYGTVTPPVILRNVRESRLVHAVYSV